MCLISIMSLGNTIHQTQLFLDDWKLGFKNAVVILTLHLRFLNYKFWNKLIIYFISVTTERFSVQIFFGSLFIG
jgi:hypothetical protein